MKYVNHFTLCPLVSLIVLATSPVESQLSVQPISQCAKMSAENCLKDIRDLANSIPPNFVLSANPVADMDLNTGTSVHGSNKLGHKCNLMRQALQCVLQYSGPCYISGMVKFDTETNLASTFLREFCDKAFHWSKMHCYTSPEIKTCESYYTPPSFASANNPATYCPNYYTFFSCAKRLIETKCPNSDMAHYPVYFLDKAFDVAWKCGTDVNLYGYGSGIAGGGYSSYGSNYPGSSYGQPPGYTGYGSQSNYPSSNYNPNYPNPNYGSPPYPATFGTGPLNQPGYQGPNTGSNYPSSSGGYSNVGYGSSGGMINPDSSLRPGPYGDHQFNLFPAENCVEKATFYARSCEDALAQRQREARYSRSAHEQQRNLCCALYYFQDCLTRQVIQYCRDPSPATVDHLMGQHKRELAMTCHDHPRHYCSSALKSVSLSSTFTIFIALIASCISIASNCT